jgi:hypothetical protein
MYVLSRVVVKRAKNQESVYLSIIKNTQPLGYVGQGTVGDDDAVVPSYSCLFLYASALAFYL